MNELGWVIAGFLAGWIVGVTMSWSKISKERRQAAKIRGMMARHFGAKLFDVLQDADIIKVTITEEGQEDVEFDQDALDEILGNKPTKH